MFGLNLVPGDSPKVVSDQLEDVHLILVNWPGASSDKTTGLFAYIVETKEDPSSKNLPKICAASTHRSFSPMNGSEVFAVKEEKTMDTRTCVVLRNMAGIYLS